MSTKVSLSTDSEEATPLPERFQELRHCFPLRRGTSAEADLLRAMQQLHTRLVTRSAQTHRLVEELSQCTTAAQVCLANAFNSLKLLAQRQFVQHRIATEDRQLRQYIDTGPGDEGEENESCDSTAIPNGALVSALPTHATTEVAVRRRMNTYVEMCRELLADEGVRIPLCPGDVAELAAENHYAHRRLCGLIGTQAFLYDVDIGCRRGANDLSAATQQQQQPLPQPFSFPVAGSAPPPSTVPVTTAVEPPSASPTTPVPPPHASVASAVALPAKALPVQSCVAPPLTAAKAATAKKGAVVLKGGRQRALFSSSSSSTSLSVSPFAVRPTATPSKNARNLFGSSSSSVVSNKSSSSGRAEAARDTADSPTSSYLSSRDGSLSPPAMARRADNLSQLPQATTTVPSSRTTSASLHSSQASSASTGALTSPPSRCAPAPSAATASASPSGPPPPPSPPKPLSPSSSTVAPAILDPPLTLPFPQAPPPPPLPLSLPGAAVAATTAAPATFPPPPPVFVFENVSDMVVPAPTLPAAAAPSLPPRGGKVLSTSSDDEGKQ